MSTRAKNRPRRSPLDVRNKLKFNGAKDPSKVYRVVNDTDGRLDEMLERGYEFVRSDGSLSDESLADGNEGKMVRKHVGNGTYGYLMAIPKEFYDEDQQTKLKALSETEQALLPKEITDAKNQHGDGLKIGSSLEQSARRAQVQHLTE